MVGKKLTWKNYVNVIETKEKEKNAKIHCLSIWTESMEWNTTLCHQENDYIQAPMIPVMETFENMTK